jgi:very-short-patch-repair endonuclease
MKENAMSDAVPSWTRRSRSPEIIRARELRRNMTSAERILWSHLRKKQIDGVRFCGQFPLGPYSADFGGEGFRVLRVWNDEVFGELGVVLAMIVNELRSS